MIHIVIQVDNDRRIKVYKEGGLDLEFHIPGIGWVVDNDADIPGHVINSYLEMAEQALFHAIRL